MTPGTVIHGYRLLGDFTTAGGGQSCWTFAERGASQYFIKEFLSPKYPVDGAPGSAATKAKQRDACAQFEAHHRKIMSALEPLTHEGGNLIVAIDFFRNGSRYYKVTEKVDVTDWDVEDVARLPLSARLLLMLTVAHSLKVLHQVGLVHGDIKPPNILVKPLEGGRFGTKLIDFDNAVIGGEPLPPPDQLVGDMAYYSPELLQYLNEPSPGTSLTTASDLFALGLVFAQWLNGRLPEFPSDARYASVAVARGERLVVPRGEAPDVAELVETMLASAPSDRPSANDLHAALLRMRRPSTDAPPPSDSPSGLRGGLAKRDKPSEGSSKLRGTLLRRSGDM
jgi:serine/threonine protein kinase